MCVCMYARGPSTYQYQMCAVWQCKSALCAVQGAKISEEGLVDELMIDAEEMHLRHTVISPAPSFLSAAARAAYS